MGKQPADDELIPPEVVQYFSAHPGVSKYSRKTSNLLNSYIRETDGSIYRLEGKDNKSRAVGKGTYGVVKLIKEPSDERPSVVKIQVVSKDELDQVLQEGEINCLLGIAKGAMHVRELEDKPGHYKVYQRMHQLGPSLFKTIRQDAKTSSSDSSEKDLAAKAQKELKTAIALLLKVHALHQQHGLAHRDIKPDNVLIDAEGKPHLIDFGTASNELDADYPFDVGSPLYMPMNLPFLYGRRNSLVQIFQGRKDLVSRLGASSAAGVNGVSNVFADRIATLRCLLHPCEDLSDPQSDVFKSSSILSKTTRDRLPASVLALLDTQSVDAHLSADRSKETEQFFAAVLLHCCTNDYQITDEEIQSLRNDPVAQENILRAHQYPIISARSQTLNHDGGSDLPSTVVSTGDEVSTVVTESTISNEANDALIPLEVIQYFAAHPGVSKYSRKISNLPNSYIREADGSIYRLEGKDNKSRAVGKGTYGAVKLIKEPSDERPSVVKVQVVSKEELEQVLREGEINYQLGVAKGAMHVRELEGKPGHYKVYQRMHQLGPSLFKTIRQDAKTFSSDSSEKDLAAKAQKELKTAIALLLKVHALHQQHGLAHRDIKPDNVLIDAEGEPHLIDFGTASNELDADYPFDVGSLLYMPMNLPFLYGCRNSLAQIFQGRKDLVSRLGASGAVGVNGVSNVFADRIATLRCLLHPCEDLSDPQSDVFKNGSILSKTTRDRLPASVLALLDTQSVDAHLSADRSKETEQFFAAVLLHCCTNDYQITGEEIQRLRSDPAAQEEILRVGGPFLLKQSYSSSVSFDPQSSHGLSLSDVEPSLFEEESSSEKEITIELIDWSSSRDAGDFYRNKASTLSVTTRAAFSRYKDRCSAIRAEGDDAPAESQSLTVPFRH